MTQYATKIQKSMEYLIIETPILSFTLSDTRQSAAFDNSLRTDYITKFVLFPFPHYDIETLLKSRHI